MYPIVHLINLLWLEISTIIYDDSYGNILKISFGFKNTFWEGNSVIITEPGRRVFLTYTFYHVSLESRLSWNLVSYKSRAIVHDSFSYIFTFKYHLSGQQSSHDIFSAKYTMKIL